MVVELIDDGAPAAVDLADGEHFSCSLSAVLLARVNEFGGAPAVARLLREAGSRRSREYLTNLGNWISYAEALALWRVGAAVTHHPEFARAVGVDSARRLSDSPVAVLLRGLGAPENIYREIGATAAKYSTVITMRARGCGPGHAELEARPVPGFPRAAEHCQWTVGLLSSTPTLFGLPPAIVVHETCAAQGASACVYQLSWSVDTESDPDVAALQVGALREQLEAMQERLHGVFSTASDLIGSDDVEEVLARIAERAATEVRAPRHLLAVRMAPDGPLHTHSRGFSAPAAAVAAERLLAADLDDPDGLPGSWLAVPVVSDRREYGRILAAFPAPGFLPQERELFQVYARFAASALDGASALERATHRELQSHALLGLAQAMSVAGTQSEIAQRLVESLDVVVDCDRVAVYLHEPEGLVREAVADPHDPSGAVGGRLFLGLAPGSTLQGLIDDPRPEPVFIDLNSSDDTLTAGMRTLGLEVLVLVPLVSARALLGVLSVSVRDRSERLALTGDLLQRLSGVAAEAGTALQNGRLLDLITYQALHDGLTGLANRSQFAAELRTAVDQAERRGERACVFYLDLDGFKPVNDELGHETGDELLVAVADRLRACVRADDLVARLGGDEFALLILAPTDHELDGVARRLDHEFAAPFEVAGRRVSISVSVGRALFPDDARDPEGLVRSADAAMFVEKKRCSGGEGPSGPSTGEPRDR